MGKHDAEGTPQGPPAKKRRKPDKAERMARRAAAAGEAQPTPSTPTTDLLAASLAAGGGGKGAAAAGVAAAGGGVERVKEGKKKKKKKKGKKEKTAKGGKEEEKEAVASPASVVEEAVKEPEPPVEEEEDEVVEAVEEESPPPSPAAEEEPEDTEPVVAAPAPAPAPAAHTPTPPPAPAAAPAPRSAVPAAADPDASGGRRYTVSIAVPGSIIANAQSAELATALAGQIARAAAVFAVDEVVVFDDGCAGRSAAPVVEETGGRRDRGRPRGRKFSAVGSSNPNEFLVRVLEFLETPQYLRRALFPVHHDLKLVGLLPPLDTPHHMKMQDWTPYREGVVVDKPLKAGCGSYVSVGLRKEAQVDRVIKPGVRVTVRLDDSLRHMEGQTYDGSRVEYGGKAVWGVGNRPTGRANAHKGVVVSPAEPRERLGLYWGYTVRLAENLMDVLNQSPYEAGYDLTIGTSERGTSTVADPDFSLPPFKHLLIVFGGVLGLEEALASDESSALPGDRVGELFHKWVNTCPGQSSGTIRTEEAVVASLAALRNDIRNSGVAGTTPK